MILLSRYMCKLEVFVKLVIGAARHRREYKLASIRVWIYFNYDLYSKANTHVISYKQR